MEGSGPAGMDGRRLTLGTISSINMATPRDKQPAKRGAPLLKPGFEDTQGNAPSRRTRERR